MNKIIAEQKGSIYANERLESFTQLLDLVNNNKTRNEVIYSALQQSFTLGYMAGLIEAKEQVLKDLQKGRET